MEKMRSVFPRLRLACPNSRRNLSSTAQRSNTKDHLSILLGRRSDTNTLRPPTPASPISEARSRYGELDQNAREGRAQLLRDARQAQQQQMENPFLQGASSIEAADMRREMQTQMARRWSPGSVYAPYDLGPREAYLWRVARRRPVQDIFAMIGDRVPGDMGDPRRHYKNMRLLAQFVHETGRIQGREVTGLKRKNQRKLAKAVRRAVGTGLMPSTMRHPEVLVQQLGFEKWRDDLGARGS